MTCYSLVAAYYDQVGVAYARIILQQLILVYVRQLSPSYERSRLILQIRFPLKLFLLEKSPTPTNSAKYFLVAEKLQRNVFSIHKFLRFMQSTTFLIILVVQRRP